MRARVSRFMSRRAMSVAAIDQALSSGSNFLIALFVARTLDLDSLGGYAVAFAVFALSVELSRAIGAEALAIRISSIDAHRGVDGVVSAAVLVGVCAAVVSAGLRAAFDGAIGDAMSMMVIFVPFAVVQDSLRSAFITIGVPGRALFSDAVWIAVQAITLIWLLNESAPGAGHAVAAWGAAAAVATTVSVAVFDVEVRPRHAFSWLAAHRDIWPRLLGEAVVRAGLTQVTFIVVAAIVGSGEFGRLRAAQIIFGPASMALLLAPLIAVPEAARQTTVEGIRTVGRVTSISLVGVVTAVMAVALVIPSGLGEFVLGDNWTEAQGLLPVTGAILGANALVAGAMASLRGAGRVDLTLRLWSFSGPLVLLSSAIAALFGIAAAAGAVAGSGLTLAVLSWYFVRTDAIAPQVASAG